MNYNIQPNAFVAQYAQQKQLMAQQQLEQEMREKQKKQQMLEQLLSMAPNLASSFARQTPQQGLNTPIGPSSNPYQDPLAVNNYYTPAYQTLLKKRGQLNGYPRF